MGFGVRIVTGAWLGLCAMPLVAALQGCEKRAASPAAPDGSLPAGWTVIPAGTANLNAVSGVSDDAVWVVGDHGTIGHWDGTKLLWEKSGTQSNLRGVWTLDTDHAFAVGDGGTILERKAGSWQQVGAKLTRQVLTAVWADTTRVVAVGSFGTVVLGGATGYQLLSSPASENIFGVTGTPGGAVTAVGALGLMLQLSGTTLTRTPITSFNKLLTGAGTGPSGAYFVGQQGTVYRADATGLNPVVGCPGTALRAVSPVDANAWVVGWDGTICEISGTTATAFPYTDNRWFNGVYAASSTALWVVGAGGTLLHGYPTSPDGGLSDASAPQGDQ
jgi:photosystem II stability/assembly factor-like uncharacterized protein